MEQNVNNFTSIKNLIEKVNETRCGKQNQKQILYFICVSIILQRITKSWIQGINVTKLLNS